MKVGYYFQDSIARLAISRIVLCSELKFLGLLWVNPENIKLSTRFFKPRRRNYLIDGSDLPKSELRKHRGFVAEGDWDLMTTSIENVGLISRTKQRYRCFQSWDDVGEIEWMMSNISEHGVQDGCKSEKEVRERCAFFDRIKDDLEVSRDFRRRSHFSSNSFREEGGIGIAIGRDGDLIWFSDGAHRLAIAQFLRLQFIPVCVHKVHAEAIRRGVWGRNLLKIEK